MGEKRGRCGGVQVSLLVHRLQILQLHLEHFKAHHQIQSRFLPADELLLLLLLLRDA